MDGLGSIDWQPICAELVAPPVWAAGAGLDVTAGAIDDAYADTAEFCEHYGVALEDSANCIVVAGKREGEVRYAACLVLSMSRADVNGVVRKRLDVRKASFAPMAEAVELTGMEYGGITPIGRPDGWPLLIDAAVLARDAVVIGSGLRRSKLAAAPAVLAALPGAEVIEGLAR